MPVRLAVGLPKRKRSEPATMEAILSKLEAAETRRCEMQKLRGIRRPARRPPADDPSPRQRLEDKLASAEAKRQEHLQAVVSRAALRHAEVQARADALKERQRQLALQFAAHLQQAEAARGAILARTSARAGQQVARVREAAAEQKLRADVELARRKLNLLQRLERAEKHRQETVQAMLAAVQGKHGGEGFLPREATRREQLRRKSSSRKLQAAWRTFSSQRQTTRALAQAFADTGVPITVPLHAQPLGPQPQPSVAANPAPMVPPMARQISAEPTPAGTPDPCSSPTSTVRRHDGRFSSAPVSIPQTPHSTPTRTPTPSVSGSPTSAARRNCLPDNSSSDHRPLPAGAVATPPAMPPLRSIAAPATPEASEVSEPPAGTFERLAAVLSAPGTLCAVQALLQRLEARVGVKGVSAGCCAGLLRRLFPRTPVSRSLERYPPRIFLCAYMVQAHPDVVFNARGEREEALTAAGRDMLSAFESLLARLVEGLGSTAEEGSAPQAPLADMLQRFDEGWVAYLEQFVAWKSADAAGLETELIRVAVELERSRLAKVAGTSTPRAHRLRSPEDMQALAAGVDHDLQLITERVRRLTGAQGWARLEAALAATRAAAAAEATALHREFASASSSDAEPADVARSPSASPIKKAHRSFGQYSGGTGQFSSAANITSTRGDPSRSSSIMSVSSSASSSTLAGARLPPAIDMDAALNQQANLALMWHLLYDPNWQLPTTELEAAWSDALGQTDPMSEAPPSIQELAAASDQRQAAVLVQQRVKRLAQRAFWDSMAERLLGTAPNGSKASQQGMPLARSVAADAVEQVAGLLGELGKQLAEVLPSGSAAAQEVGQKLDSRQLLSALLLPSRDGLNVPALFGLLEWCAGLLARYGAPARDTAAAAGQAAVRAQLAAAGGDVGMAGAAAVRALRLLAVQLKMLRVDAANSHLRSLSTQLHTDGAAAYAALKYEAMLGSPSSYEEVERLGSWMPHTRAWLAAASGQLPHVEQLAALSDTSGTASASGSSGSAQGQHQPGHQALPQLRTGLRASAGSSAQGRQRMVLHAPVEARSWRGLVRLGLVQLVSGEGSIGRLPLPETLRLDATRLHASQGEFQRLLVLTISLLLVRQGANTAGRVLSAADVAAIKRRLAALLADPGMRLPDLAAECCQLSGGETSVAREQAVQDSINRMLSRSSGAMKALTSGITSALLTVLLLGPDSAHAQEQAALALRRCGAGDLAFEAAELARQLAAVSAVSEAVCAPWYQRLSSDML